MKPCTIEMRLTTDWDSQTKGLHLWYPLGLQVSYLHDHQRIEIPLGRIFLQLEPDARDGWTWIIDQTGQSLYKFITPTKVTDDYNVYKFYANGVTYILEFRIVNFYKEIDNG